MGGRSESCYKSRSVSQRPLLTTRRVRYREIGRVAVKTVTSLSFVTVTSISIGETLLYRRGPSTISTSQLCSLVAWRREVYIRARYHHSWFHDECRCVGDANEAASHWLLGLRCGVGWLQVRPGGRMRSHCFCFAISETRNQARHESVVRDAQGRLCSLHFAVH